MSESSPACGSDEIGRCPRSGVAGVGHSLRASGVTSEAGFRVRWGARVCIILVHLYLDFPDTSERIPMTTSTTGTVGMGVFILGLMSTVVM